MLPDFKRRKYKFFSLILIAIILLSISYYILQNKSEEHHNKYESITSDEYESLLNSTIQFLGKRIRKFEPWIIPSCPTCNTPINKTIQIDKLESEINDTEALLNKTLNDLISPCYGTLWEAYVKRVALGYWLGIKFTLDKAKEYLYGIKVNMSGQTITIRKNSVIAYKYLVAARYLLSLLQELKETNIKEPMCRVDINQFKEFTWDLYVKFKQILNNRKKDVLDKINIDELKSSKYRFIIRIMASKISRELESGNHIYSNETIFREILNKKPMMALEMAVDKFITIYEYMDALSNVSKVENLEKLVSSENYIKNHFDQIRTTIITLYNRSDGNIIKYLVAHIIARRLIRVCVNIEETLREYTSSNAVINESQILALFIDDPNNIIMFIDLIFILKPTNLVINVIEG